MENYIKCTECDGYGSYESQRPVGNSEGKDYYIVSITCEECYGSGVIPPDEEYIKIWD